jgi:hypothetical protein
MAADRPADGSPIAATGRRSQVRLPAMDLRVDLTTAETVAPSVQSIRRDGSLDQ